MRTLLVVLVLFDTSFLREAARGSSRLIRRGIVDSTPMHPRRWRAVPHIHTGPTIVAALRGAKREGGGMTGCSRLEVYCSYLLLQSLLGLSENVNG